MVDMDGYLYPNQTEVLQSTSEGHLQVTLNYLGLKQMEQVILSMDLKTRAMHEINYLHPN
jgi:hypothetical protein